VTDTAPAGQWPVWAQTWYGYALRVLVALWGTAGGLFMVLIGYFTAVDWKTGESNWTTGAALLIIGGVALAIYCLVGAIRPTKVSFMPPLILFVITVTGSLLALVTDFARNLASS
jgi:hypothetical protein